MAFLALEMCSSCVPAGQGHAAIRRWGSVLCGNQYTSRRGAGGRGGGNSEGGTGSPSLWQTSEWKATKALPARRGLCDGRREVLGSELWNCLILHRLTSECVAEHNKRLFKGSWWRGNCTASEWVRGFLCFMQNCRLCFPMECADLLQSIFMCFTPSWWVGIEHSHTSPIFQGTCAI